MRPLRASELGSYLYCQRAWWYQQQGVEQKNISELAAGSQLHKTHSRQVFLAGFLNFLAWAFLLIGLIALIVLGVNYWL